MQTVLLGKVVKKKYEAVRNCEERMIDGELVNVFISVPELKVEETVDEWREFCRYDGEPRFSTYRSINPWTIRVFDDVKTFIYKGEKIHSKNEIFHADLNEVHLETDKVLETIEENKEIAESLHSTDMYFFNVEMIKSNEALKAYCDLHKLDYGSTDCLQLFKIVYPNKEWKLVDGKMVVFDSSISCRVAAIEAAIDNVAIYGPAPLLNVKVE